MPDQARVTRPDAKIMLGTGLIRIPALPTNYDPAKGYTEFQPAGWEVETIPDPEPRWEPNDAVRDATGVVFVRTPAGRWLDALGQDRDPVRPLTKLLPAP